MYELAQVGATISSMELVDMINSVREEGRAELRHAEFLRKVPKVLNGTERKFASSYKDSSGKQNLCYNFPKREASLMVMSESYEVQAKVYDRMEELEGKSTEQPRTYEVIMKEALLLADQRVKQLEEKIQIDKPKVSYAEAVAGSEGSIKIEDWCKNISSRITLGRNTAFEWMRERGYLMGNNRPYQSYIDQGIFECKETLIVTPYGSKKGFTTLVTGKGSVYLLDKYLQKEGSQLQFL